VDIIAEASLARRRVNLPFSIVKTRTGYRVSLSLPDQGQSTIPGEDDTPNAGSDALSLSRDQLESRSPQVAAVELRFKMQTASSRPAGRQRGPSHRLSHDSLHFLREKVR
jgi:hypothetical protein